MHYHITRKVFMSVSFQLTAVSVVDREFIVVDGKKKNKNKNKIFINTDELCAHRQML